MKSPFVLSAFLFWASSVALCSAREISMTTTNWPPFYAEHLPNKGPLSEIVTEALKRTHYTSAIEFQPWVRARRSVHKGENDLILGAYYSDHRAEKHIFSDPIMMVNVGIVSNKGHNIRDYKTLHDLVPFTIGVSKGWVNNVEFDNANYLSKDFADNQVHNVRKLVHQRVDMISISFEVFRYELAKLNKPESNYVYLKPLLSRSSLHLMMHKGKEDHQEVITAFNRALTEMKADGSYQHILKKHGLDSNTASAP